MVTELMSGFRVVGTSLGENVYGLAVLPSYRFSPHLEGVFRYQLSHGRDAVKMYARYVPAVTTYPKWVSTMNSFYFGLNYYFFPEDPDMLKLMAGGNIRRPAERRKAPGASADGPGLPPSGSTFERGRADSFPPGGLALLRAIMREPFTTNSLPWTVPCGRKGGRWESPPFSISPHPP
ncbi:hypothetical protein PVA48_04940 [Akkermansia sp. JRP_AM1]